MIIVPLRIRLPGIWLLAVWLPFTVLAADKQSYSFDDRPTDYEGGHPPWFEQSFLDLREDLDGALKAGKKGLILYFGQPSCAYCKAMMEDNLSRPDVVEYVRRNFNVVGLDIRSTEELTSPDGEVMTVADFARREQAQFTPTLILYGPDRAKALTLRGFYPAYTMRAALEYVVDGHYRRLSFRGYLDQADAEPKFDGELNDDPLFAEPPYALDRSRFAAQRPLLVMFEQPKCHACDVLHSEPMQNPLVRDRLKDFDMVQLDVWDRQTPVLTPDGRRLTPHQWAVDLELFYTPSLLFFDERGREVFRVDSVVQFFRLASVLRYVAEQGYREYPLFQHWKIANAAQERDLAGGRDKPAAQ